MRGVGGKRTGEKEVRKVRGGVGRERRGGGEGEKEVRKGRGGVGRGRRGGGEGSGEDREEDERRKIC